MRPVHAIASHIVSALGLGNTEHWRAASNGFSALQAHNDHSLSKTPFYGSIPDATQWQVIHDACKSNEVLSPFEQLCIFSAKRALEQLDQPLPPQETLLILSSTKGNVEWLNDKPEERILLSTSAQKIADALHLLHRPLVVSHACVSGVLALQLGMRLLSEGKYKHAVVVGADRLTRFVLSGFQSFQAIADAPCRPFDVERKGINLGEAAATIILSTAEDRIPLAQIVSGSSSNDANHISGPSRTGAELALAVHRALQMAKISPDEIDMISAHGTATLYNDEMEAKAFSLAGLSQTPLHSFKGFIGHVLGAAGIVESVMTIESIKNQVLIPSPGFSSSGVSEPVNVTTIATPANIRYALKTASGFGGCNAVAVWKRVT